MEKMVKAALAITIFLFLATGSADAQSIVPSTKEQIQAAVSPAPKDLQEEAGVLGYNANNELTTLREGTNQLICIADNPDQSNFHVSCYHKDLEPFMRRGRELRAQGLSRKKVDSLRREEIKSDQINLPQRPMALYSLTGPENAFDYGTGQVVKASPLYVVYIPFATEASTGLSKQPASKGGPWIMEPGTPWAHIMIMTGRDIGRKESSSGN